MSYAGSGNGKGAWRVRPDRPPPLVDVGSLTQIFWEASSDLLVVTDREGVLLTANPAWHRTLGWTPSHTPRRMRDLIHPDDREAATCALETLEAGDHFEAVELWMLTVDGNRRQISWSGVCDGRRMCVAGRDTTATHRAERAARQTADFWQATLDSIQGQVAIVDEHGGIVAVNESWREFGRDGGRTEATHLGESYLDVCARAGDEPGGRQAVEGILELLAGRQEPVVFDYALGDRWFTFTATVFTGDGPARIVITHSDVTDRRRMEQEAQATAAVFDQLQVAVVGTDLAHITRWSGGAERLYGWSAAEALGQSATDLITRRPVAPLVGEGTVLDGLFELDRKDGSTFVGHQRWTELHDGDGQVTGTLGVGMDVSAQHRAENEAAAARNHLRAVTDSMSEGLFALDRDGGVTLMNHAAESMLGWSLDDVRGQRLHDITLHRGSDGTGHPGDDCPVLRAGHEDQELRVEDDVFLCRDGIALPVSYTVTPLVTADGVEGCVVVFMDATHVRAEQQRLQQELSALVWIQRVEAALVEDRFLLYSQPIVELSSGTVTQSELLLRVQEKDGTISPPGDYLSTAETYGLIGDVDRWVIPRAIDHAARGHAVEVNVSASSVSDPKLLADIERWLLMSCADPALLVFEITETALISNEEAGHRFVERIHELGCKVALDDFGTGYGGFTYLKRLPVDYLKIDIEFVHDLCLDSSSRHVVEAVVNLARGFGLQTVAEGVENQETLELLTELGVDFAQGYHLGRPAPFSPTTVRQDRKHPL